MALQKTFKESYMKKLRDDVKSGASLSLYAKENFEIDETKVKFLANVYEPVDLPQKMELAGDSDFKAGITLFEAYKDISPLLASSEAFWAYLTHTSLFAYTQKRWPNVLDGTASSQYIIEHWFVDSSTRILRNAVAALWWGVYTTIDEEREDKYELTRILFSNFTMRVINLGSYPLIRHREAMIGILGFLNDNADVMSKAEVRVSFLTKYFNRLGAVKQLSALDRNYFYTICTKLKPKIMSVTKREQLTDDSLYSDI